MSKKDLSYISLIGIHIAIGLLVYLVPFLAKAYTLSIFIYGVYYVVKNKNRNNEVLDVSAYIVSAEVLLRMRDGMILNEFGKYSVLVFMFMGMYYSSFLIKGFWYWFFIFLLIPGVVLSVFTMDYNTDIRKAIAFNLSGPVCLGVASVYCFQRKITLQKLIDLIGFFSLPLISMAVYLFLYTPSVRDVVMGTESNFETSGGFGPNQVSTILGFGIFVFFTQFLLNSKSSLIKVLNLVLTLIFAFRGIVTFSRGGVLTGVVMIILLLVVVFFQLNSRNKSKVFLITIISFLGAIGVWGYSSIQTNGLINKRYANQDAKGREKESKFTGREVLFESEIDMFLDNPFMGVGVGRNKEIRKKETGIVSASHNELTRMLAEHGTFGILGLLILFLTPLILYASHPQHLMAFSFYAFWLLTINHAAMRLAAPAFIYSLSLLRVELSSV